MTRNDEERRFAPGGSWWESSNWISQWQIWEGKVTEWWQSPLELLSPGSVSSVALPPMQELDASADIDSELVSHLAVVLPAVEPDPAFRQRLKLALTAAHQQKTAQHILFSTRGDIHLWTWPMLASVPVVLGIAALIWHRSHRSPVETIKAA